VYSMTGYASKVFELEYYTAQIDIRSVNSKFLDMRFRLPFTLEHMEERLRKLLKMHVKRGKVDIFLKLTAHEQLELNTMRSLIDKYYRIIKKIQDEMNAKFPMSLSEILSLKNLINPYEEFLYREIPSEKIEEIFLDTVAGFQESRYFEGENTKKEILSHLELINDSLAHVSATYPAVVERYKVQLKEKVQELIEGKIDETRIMMEVGIFANKVDISEEISRIKGHVSKMMNALQSEEACGRELDFILQELNREVNTIGSKVPDYSVSEEVVNMKSCLEKIKEQVRNVE
jgi:uncharacterized protein (TIGR00255 family)